MKWTSTELHIENLIPGVLIGVSAIILCPKLKCLSSVLYNQIAKGLLVVAGCYALGLLSNLVSRAALDWLSERYTRARVFEVFAHSDRESLVRYFQKIDGRFRSDLDWEIKKRGLLGPNRLNLGYRYCVAQWNAIYRAALRNTSRIEEVDRRRSQGRLVRNLFSPALLGVFLVTNGDTSMSVVVSVFSIFLCGSAMLFFYSYAELQNFQEALDIGRHQERVTQAGKRVSSHK